MTRLRQVGPADIARHLDPPLPARPSYLAPQGHFETALE
jgi:hypothetical protein